MATMDKIDTVFFFGFLKEHRKELNQSFENMKLFKSGLEQSVFLHILQKYTMPLVQKIYMHHPEKADESALALYDLSLTLYSRKYIGPQSHFPLISKLFEEVLPRISTLVAQAPATLPASLINALFSLLRISKPVASMWLDEIVNIAPGCKTYVELIDAGKVLAWKCGMAQWRGSALKIWRKLSKPLKLATLGLLLSEDNINMEELGQQLEDPWFHPHFHLHSNLHSNRHTKGETKSPVIIAKAGGFTGFGCEMATPPEVISINDQIYAFDDYNCWSLHCDAFGTILVSEGRDLPDEILPATSNTCKITPTGILHWNGLSETIPVLKHSSSIAASEDFVAVTCKSSFYIFIIALSDKERSIV